MIQDRQIAQWASEGLITEAQAQRMLADVTAQRRARTSDRFIVVLSTVGSVLLGVGAILFIAANWEGLSSAAKTALLLAATFGVSALGYALAYGRRTLPRVGEALLFLGGLLFGATVFLIAQMYHLQANSHALVLIWLVGILPLVYVIRSLPLAGLAALLAFIWVGLVVMAPGQAAGRDWVTLPALYLLCGLSLFEAGGQHDTAEPLRGIARIYRLGALKVVMLALFLLSFRFFSGHLEGWWSAQSQPISGRMTIAVAVAGALALTLGLLNLSTNPTRSSTWRVEGAISLGLAGLALLLVFAPTTTTLYVVAFNLALAGCIAALVGIGYQREDIRLVNVGMSYLTLLVLVRYCDWFWALLPRSLFFMVGGVILVLGGVALERKRRALKTEFAR